MDDLRRSSTARLLRALNPSRPRIFVAHCDDNPASVVAPDLPNDKRVAE